jgi:NADH-quinone oxidoreductase subunit N
MSYNLNWFHILPELLLLLSAIFIQLVGLFFKIESKKLATISSVLLILIAVVTYNLSLDSSIYGAYFENWMKIFLLSFCIISNIFFSISSGQTDIEFLPLTLFACLGGFIVISAKDLLTIFIGIELQSLVSYVLASLYKRSSISSEAGLKYLTLGAISSCLMLFGISFIYGFNGSIDYNYLANLDFDPISSFAVSIIILSFLFKLAAAPLHIWLPDVYHGGPSFSVSTFISVNKLTTLVGLVNLLSSAFNGEGIIKLINDMLTTVAVLSLIIGSFGALKQTNFKRFIAYSSIFNISYVLLSLIIKNYDLAIFYLLIYTLNVLLVFGIIINSRLNLDDLEIKQLAGFGHANKSQAILLAICLFSLLGLPPLFGFVGKYYVLYAAILSGYYYLVLLVSGMTVIAAYYYLRIIKTIFFDEPAKLINIRAPRSFLLDVLNTVGVGILCFAWIVLNQFERLF